jgi:drug/metabolite transporter (DMT)-like permease
MKTLMNILLFAAVATPIILIVGFASLVHDHIMTADEPSTIYIGMFLILGLCCTIYYLLFKSPESRKNNEGGE